MLFPFVVPGDTIWCTTSKAGLTLEVDNPGVLLANLLLAALEIKTLLVIRLPDLLGASVLVMIRAVFVFALFLQ